MSMKIQIPIPPSSKSLTTGLEVPHRLLAQAQATPRRPRAQLRSIASMATAIDDLFTYFRPPADARFEHDPVFTAQQLTQLALSVAPLLDGAAQLLCERIVPRLRARGFSIVGVEELDTAQQQWLKRYFQHRIYPLLIPLIVDPGHPFPFIQGRNLNLLIEFAPELHPHGHLSSTYARVKVPPTIPRIVQVPTRPAGANVSGERSQSDPGAPVTGVWSEQIVRNFIGSVFPGVTVQGTHFFRLLRLQRAENDAYAAQGRQQRPVSRLDVQASMPAAVQEWLLRNLAAAGGIMIQKQLPLQLSDLALIADQLPLHVAWGLPRWLVRAHSTVFGHI